LEAGREASTFCGDCVGLAWHRREAVAAALKSVSGPKILLADGGQHFTRDRWASRLLPRQPIIPFSPPPSDCGPGLRHLADRVSLPGIQPRRSGHEDQGGISESRAFPGGCPIAISRNLKNAVSRLRERLLLARGEPLPIHALTTAGGEHLIATSRSIT